MVRLNKESIIKEIEKRREEIRNFGVKKIGLFGSFLNGAGKKKDIDFLVKLKKPTFDNYMELKFFLEKIFNKKVDLIIEDNLKPALHYVKKEAVYVKRL